MTADLDIKNNVLDELAWQPSIDETQIGVIVKNGVVTLTGIVDSYTNKMAAEKAAKSVYGVKAVAEDIEVRYSNINRKSDTDIANATVDALKWNSLVPDKNIHIKVEDGWIYLTGEVQWIYEKNAAKNAVKNLYGVNGVVNNIRLKSTLAPSVIKKGITKAFERSADLSVENINISVEGNTVTLMGTAHSITDMEQAEKAAYFAPGVTKVINKLKISHYREFV